MENIQVDWIRAGGIAVYSILMFFLGVQYQIAKVQRLRKQKRKMGVDK